MLEQAELLGRQREKASFIASCVTPHKDTVATHWNVIGHA
jgi:hypothetical protein